MTKMRTLTLLWLPIGLEKFFRKAKLESSAGEKTQVNSVRMKVQRHHCFYQDRPLPMCAITKKAMTTSKIDEEEINLLMEKTFDVLVLAGWLVRVVVTKDKTNDDDRSVNDVAKVSTSRRGGNDKTSLEVLMPIDASVYGVKLVTSSHTGIKPKELRFFNAINGKPVYHGPLVPNVISSSEIDAVKVNYKRKSLDPRLESLYEMVHMGNEVERDELMRMMTQSRKAGECYCGQRLASAIPPPAVEGADENRHEDPEALAATCNMCHFETNIHFTHSCRQCRYSLCSICYNKDVGHECSEDPDKDIVQMAEDLGARFAGPASWFTGPGRGCTLPSITFPVEVVPRRYRRSSSYVDKVKIDKTTQVLHGGVNLKISVDGDIRQMLEEEGEDWKQLELDQILKDGATVCDIMCHRNLLMRSSVWPIIEKRLHEKVYKQQSYVTGSGHRKQPSVLFCNTIMKLCMFSTNEVEFSISAVAHVDYTHYC